MWFLKRVGLVVVALMMVAAESAVPAGALEAESSGCVTHGGSVNAQRAVLTPTGTIAEDVAFNHDDPDAANNPLALIPYPGEETLWITAQVAAGDDIVGEVNAIPAVSDQSMIELPERSDREVSDSIVRLFCGLFDRMPSAAELDYWAGRYWNGLPLVTIAESFTHAREFINRFGDLSDEALIAALYTKVLGRDAAPGTAQAVAARIGDGEIHRGHAVVQVTESGEYVMKTGTAAPEKPLLPYPNVGSGRRIVYSNTDQRIWLIEETGELYKTHLVSGRRGIPAAGRYNVFSKSRYAYAYSDGITMEFMVRFARTELNYGFHSIPIYPDKRPLQTPAQLGTRRSGGCVRQIWDDAQITFEWAPVGTRVIVLP